jgi:outer membrane protein TolC
VNRQTDSIRAPRRWVRGGPLGAVALLAGCVSLDPAGDVGRASDLVVERAETETGWTSPWYVPAEAWDGRAPLSSDVAVRVALQNNRAIRRQVESIAATRADFVQAHLLPNPVINLAYGFTTDGLGGDPLAVTVVQQLAWLWRRPAAIDEADAELRSRVLAVSDAALRLVAEVRRAHARVHFASRAVALERESIELLGRSADLLRERFSVGEASRLDINRVEFELQALEVNLVDHAADLATAKRALLALMGRADAGTDWPTDDRATDAVEATVALEESDAMTLAVRHRLDVAAADAVVAARVAGVSLEERGRLPDVGMGVGYQQNFSDRRGVFPSVTVTPKIFDDNSARVARAASKWRQAEIEADRVREVAIAETRSAWVALRAQQEAARAYESEIVALAESNVALAQAAFDAGEADLTVLLETQRQLNDARIDGLARQQAVAEQLIELERAVGGTLEVPAEPVVASSLHVNEPRVPAREAAP